MKATLAVFALAITTALAVPTPVQPDVVAREAAPAPQQTDFGTYGEYGAYGTYDSYPSPVPTPTPTPTAPAGVVTYASYAPYSSYKRAIGDLVKKFWHA